MAVSPLAFNPAGGWQDTANIESKPANESRTRQLLQMFHGQTRDYINNVLLGGSGTVAADTAASGSPLDSLLKRLTASTEMAGDLNALYSTGCYTISVDSGTLHAPFNYGWVLVLSTGLFPARTTQIAFSEYSTSVFIRTWLNGSGTPTAFRCI